MKFTSNVDNGVIIIASHATPLKTNSTGLRMDGVELEVGRFDASEVFSFTGQRERLVQLFEAAAKLLKNSNDEYCFYLFGGKTVASNDPNLAEIAKAK